MNKILTTLFLIIFSVKSFAQNKADSLFKAGCKSFEEKDFSKAINCFKEVAQNYNDFEYYNQSLYNLAYTYDEADSLDQAVIWYERIRASKVKDNDKVGGRGIFEPFSNYKHYSTFNIANIEYNRGNYEKALDYYNQCLTKYTYYNESGTDIRINKNKLKIYLVDCLVKLKKFDEALSIIIPQALDSYGSANYKSVVNTAINLIDSNFDRKQIKSELEESFKTLKQNKNHNQFTISWKGKTVNLFPYAVGEDITVSSLVEKIKQSDLWLQLIK